MKKYFLLLVAGIHFNGFACRKENVEPQEPIIHQGPKKGWFASESPRSLAGYIYNDTSQPISFAAQGATTVIKPQHQAGMPAMVHLRPGLLFQFSFNKIRQNAPLHLAVLGQWISPDMGDYAIIIKKDTSGVTDLDLDVVPKKELDALKAKRAKELQEKVGGKVYEAGVQPKPVANIAAEYVGTDVELPEE